MKKILFFFLISVSFCTPQREGGKDLGFLLLILQNQPAANGVSVLTLERIDPVNFTGDCLDGFFGIAAGQYFSVLNLSAKNNDKERSAVSNLNCSLLGFRSFGSRIRTESGFEYNVSNCGPRTQACSTTAIRQVGF